MTLTETIKEIRPLDLSIERTAQERLDSLTKPPGSLGELEVLARRIAVIQGRVPPRLGRKMLFVFAADHGITQEGAPGVSSRGAFRRRTPVISPRRRGSGTASCGRR